MWCVPTITTEFIARMEHILELYHRPLDPRQPIICVDEKSKQLLLDKRLPLPVSKGKPKRIDYEYKRAETRNIFMAVEPKAGYRQAEVTQRRTNRDFARFIQELLTGTYRDAEILHVVVDNLSTHSEAAMIQRFGHKAYALLARLEFHYTPKHASWLNMAEIELSILSRQCLKGRIPTEQSLKDKMAVWQQGRNDSKALINWKFTVADARQKFQYTPINRQN